MRPTMFGRDCAVPASQQAPPRRGSSVVERLTCNQDVASSTLASGSIRRRTANRHMTDRHEGATEGVAALEVGDRV